MFICVLTFKGYGCLYVYVGIHCNVCTVQLLWQVVCRREWRQVGAGLEVVEVLM
jgi:hypothetical protein